MSLQPDDEKQNTQPTDHHIHIFYGMGARLRISDPDQAKRARKQSKERLQQELKVYYVTLLLRYSFKISNIFHCFVSVFYQ